jgi:hypothetical protein
MAAGIPAENISLSTQELPADFADLIEMGVKVNAWYVVLTPFVQHHACIAFANFRICAKIPKTDLPQT